MIAMQEAMNVNGIKHRDAVAVFAKCILCEWFCQCIGNLIICADGKDFDESQSNMLLKVMLANIDVFSQWT